MSKLTVQLNADMAEMLDQLADSRGLPKTQVMRDAVKLMKYLDDAVADHSDLVLRRRQDGSEMQIVLESQIRA